MLILAAAELQIRQNEGRVFLNKKACNPCQNYSTCTVEKVIFEDEPNIFSNSALLT